MKPGLGLIAAATALFLAGCAAQPPPSRTGAPVTTAPPSASPPSASPAGPAFVTCREPNPNTMMIAALEHVTSYAFSTAGFVYVADFTSDPNGPPRTRRASSVFEGAFVAPDRAWTRYRTAASAEEPDESIAIGRDLWIRDRGGWQHLPGATDPAIANELASLIRDAGPGWQSVPGASDLPGQGCLFRIRVPVTSGGKGYREVAARADPLTGLPSAVRVVVKDALDPFGNRHDSDLTYRVRYVHVPAIEPPAEVSPSPS